MQHRYSFNRLFPFSSVLRPNRDLLVHTVSSHDHDHKVVLHQRFVVLFDDRSYVSTRQCESCRTLSLVQCVFSVVKPHINIAGLVTSIMVVAIAPLTPLSQENHRRARWGGGSEKVRAGGLFSSSSSTSFYSSSGHRRYWFGSCSGYLDDKERGL